MMRVAVIIVCFLIGYFITGLIIKKFKNSRNKYGTFHDSTYQEKDYDSQTYHHDFTKDDVEQKYRETLGLSGNDSHENIKQKFKKLISKYHPDKVQHLGLEFQVFAEKKTKAILEAYQYFQNKNRI